MAESTTKQPKSAGTTGNRLSVETAVRQIGEDCREIRDKLKLPLIIPNPNDFARIKEEATRLMDAKGRAYSYYEIGFRFIVDHVVASLKDKINLNENEERLLRSAMGRVYYNPPIREYTCMAEAADTINENKGRSGQILEAWLKEVSDLRPMYLSVGRSYGTSESPFTSVAKNSDMFDNPFVRALIGPSMHANGPPMYYNGKEFSEIHNFGDIAAMKREDIPSMEKNERGSVAFNKAAFYE
jgi:hypothetical protein